MQYRLEHKIGLLTETTNTSLYDWAIIESDEEGQQIGRDQIPWPWTLRFVATSIVLLDCFSINCYASSNNMPDQPDIQQSQMIRAKLCPNGRDEPNYSMFGTDRFIQSFELEIRIIDTVGNNDDIENFWTWGTCSYTSDLDFSEHTTDDCIIFYLLVKPEIFKRYSEFVSHNLINEVSLSVGRVDGFYSEWSPRVSTNNIKVLTTGDEHKIEAPPGFDVPRLGKVGIIDLSLNKRLKLSQT